VDDRQIIKLYFDRSERAITATNKKYGKYCFAVANNVLSDKRDCEECVNDTWMTAWNTIPPTVPDVLKLFLAKITRNLAINRLKNDAREKRGSRELPIAHHELSDLITDNEDTESTYDQKMLSAAINGFIKNLRPLDCTVFVLRYFYLSSIPSIANSCRISQDNVHKILSRTRQKLKKYLESEGFSI
jgi:RNA polymerase sigma-70 factor (ECF subfamily)